MTEQEEFTNIEFSIVFDKTADAASVTYYGIPGVGDVTIESVVKFSVYSAKVKILWDTTKRLLDEYESYLEDKNVKFVERNNPEVHCFPLENTPVFRGESWVAVVYYRSYESWYSENLIIVAYKNGRGEIVEQWPDSFRIGNNHVIHYANSYSEEFEHDWDIEEDLLLSDDDLVEIYRQRFENEINPSLNDPFILNGHDDDKPLTFIRGSYEELERQVTEACHAFMPSNCGPIHLVFEAPGDERGSCELVDVHIMSEDRGVIWYNSGGSNNNNNLPDEFLKEIKKALDGNWFVGYRTEYNDGPNNRESGYSTYPETLTIVVEKPTSHQRMAARKKFTMEKNNQANV